MTAEKAMSARNTDRQQRRLLAATVVASLVFSACASSTSVATISGASGGDGVGEVIFASSCASCHGTRGEGGTGPPLAGHTAEQIIRQVRAPVGNMPVFGPEKISPAALDDLVEMITGLHLEGGAPHDGDGASPHDEARLSKQEVSQLQHALILDLLEQDDAAAAAHALEEVIEPLSGTHSDAMAALLEDIEAGRTDQVQSRLLDMAAHAPLTDGLNIDALLLTLALDDLRGGDEAASHWFDHLSVDSDLTETLLPMVLEARFRRSRRACRGCIARSQPLSLNPPKWKPFRWSSLVRLRRLPSSCRTGKPDPARSEGSARRALPPETPAAGCKKDSRSTITKYDYPRMPKEQSSGRQRCILTNETVDSS